MPAGAECAVNPAYSIIFFTTASGAGYGLLVLAGAYAGIGALPGDRGLAAATLALALVLVSGGLLSSTFHLGHPERAWRAFSQWRSSWLSREGVFAVATYVPAGAFAIAWLALDDAPTVALAGLAAALAALATVLCTAMIYASLRAVPAWHNPWVLPGYVSLGLMTGGLWLAALGDAFGADLPGVVPLAIGLVLAAGACKLAYWRSVDQAPTTSSVESATGLGSIGGHLTRARLLEPPHTEPSYLQREMGYVVARRHARRLREHAALLAFALPIMALGLAAAFDGPLGLVATVLAAALGSIGVVIERWLFFAEAKHKVGLYYGEAAV